MKRTIIIYVHNINVISLSKNPKFHAKSKHIDIQFHYICEQIEEKSIQLEYTPTTFMTVGIFTKHLFQAKHHTCMKLFKHIPLPKHLEKNSNKKEKKNLNVFAHVMMTQFYSNVGGYVQPLYPSKFCHNTHLNPSSFYGKQWVQRPYK